MARRAFILGGTGQIGRAVAAAFLSSNWNVTISHRGARPEPRDLIERGARVVVVNRNTAGNLARALGTGADVLVDTTAYNQNHGSQLIAIQSSIGRFVVVSSASIYRDDCGRTLDEAAQSGFPELPEPIPETHPTVNLDRPPIPQGRLRWSNACSMTPPRQSRSCGPAQYMA